VVDVQRLSRLLWWKNHRTCDDRADRIEPIDERGHHPKIAASASDRPEEIRVLGRARPQQVTIGGDHIGRDEIVAG
jgi:hypothetical protein